MNRALIVLLIPIFSVGCVDAQEEVPAVDRKDHVAVPKVLIGDLPSANYLLLPSQAEAFKPGRLEKDVLKDVNWRGNFGMACQYKENNVTAITFELVLQHKSDTMNIEGEWLFAVFGDNKFEKFIEPSKPDANDVEEVPYEGTTWSRPKPIMIGDMSRFIRELESKPIDMPALVKELRTRPEAPSQIDPGLTAAYLLLKSQGLTPVPASKKDYVRNAELRDQFNAARLNIGMTSEQVRSVFKAKPLESGRVAAGTFEVYGSNASFDIDPALLYSNVLVLYKDGKASVIYGIAGGSDWRENAQQEFVDFPRTAK